MINRQTEQPHTERQREREMVKDRISVKTEFCLIALELKPPRDLVV